MSSTCRSFVVQGLGLSLAIAGACSNTHGTDPDTSARVDVGTSTPDTGVAPPDDAYVVPYDSGPWQGECITLTFPPINAPVGMEDTQCVVLDLGNTLPMHVHALHNILGTGSHHFIVYRGSATEVLNSTPTHCTPFVDTLSATSGSPLMITQRHDELLTLPGGVAYTLPPHQTIRLELHYINLTSAPLTLSPTAQLCPIPDSQFTDEADFLFIGNPDVNIPAHSTATLGPTFYPLDRQFGNAHFFAITGHTHALGTNVLVQTAGSATGPFVDVYNVPGWSWAEPATVTQTSPFMVPAGGGFNFTCDWNNTTSSAVTFGEHTTNEMCFFWAYYYPAHARAPHVCIHTAQYGGQNICCPGSAVCNLISSRF